MLHSLLFRSSLFVQLNRERAMTDSELAQAAKLADEEHLKFAVSIIHNLICICSHPLPQARIQSAEQRSRAKHERRSRVHESTEISEVGRQVKATAVAASGCWPRCSSPSSTPPITTSPVRRTTSANWHANIDCATLFAPTVHGVSIIAGFH